MSPSHSIAPVLALMALSTTTRAQAPADNDLREAVHSHMTALSEQGFSGAVLIARPGRVVLHRGYGQANRDEAVPIDTQTVFDIGSVSKQFIKAAILKLEEMGRLDTRDPIGRYLSNAPADKAGITIDHLINMRAGLSEYLDREGEQGDFTPLDRDEALERILGEQLRFPPGEDRAYSNTGYTMLAILVEIVSGQSFQSFLREHLLDPAGLDRTGFYQERRWQERDVAIGYDAMQFGSNSPYHWPEIQWALMGNGGMVSSPAELHRWIMALADGKVLSPTARKKLYANNLPEDPAPSDRRYILYAGTNNFGFNTAVMELYGDRGVVIVSSNTRARILEIVRSLAELTLAEPVQLDLGRQTTTESEQGPPEGGWGLPDSPRGRVAAALLDMIAAGTPEAAREFVTEMFDATLRDAEPLSTHLARMEELQRDLRTPEVMGVAATGPTSLRLMVAGQATGRSARISLELTPDVPYRVISIRIERPGGNDD